MGDEVMTCANCARSEGKLKRLRKYPKEESYEKNNENPENMKLWEALVKKHFNIKGVTAKEISKVHEETMQIIKSKK